MTRFRTRRQRDEAPVLPGMLLGRTAGQPWAASAAGGVVGDAGQDADAAQSLSRSA